MNVFLLDTNCISELVRVEPHPRVIAWARSVDENQLYLSVLTLGEIRKGATLLPASRRRSQLEHWLDIDLPAQYAERLLAITADIAEVWGRVAGEAQLRGTPTAIIDGLIGATAMHHDLTLVTRNVRDFRMWEVQIANPWELT
jgi:toxin FitB